MEFDWRLKVSSSSVDFTEDLDNMIPPVKLLGRHGWDQDDDKHYSIFQLVWENWEQDMTEFSKIYPDVLFELERSGGYDSGIYEEDLALYKSYFLNGKTHTIQAKVIWPQFDPTMLEELTIDKMIDNLKTKLDQSPNNIFIKEQILIYKEKYPNAKFSQLKKMVSAAWYEYRVKNGCCD